MPSFSVKPKTLHNMEMMVHMENCTNDTLTLSLRKGHHITNVYSLTDLHLI